MEDADTGVGGVGGRGRGSAVGPRVYLAARAGAPVGETPSEEFWRA